MTTTRTMSIRLNGKERDVPAGTTVRSLLDDLDLHPGMIVVELNREILERDGVRSVFRRRNLTASTSTGRRKRASFTTSTRARSSCWRTRLGATRPRTRPAMRGSRAPRASTSS